jgi:hypothetical protein
MLTRKIKMKFTVPLAVVLALGSVEANAGMIIDADLAKLTVFSKTYTTTGAGSVVHGSMLVGGVATTGANAAVNGDVTSVGAANIGGGTATVTGNNTAKVQGNVISHGVLTVGGATGVGPIGPIISGSIISSGASTIGAYAKVGGDMLSGGVATTGAQSLVEGNVLSTGAATTGANGDVQGKLSSGGIATIGANSDVTGSVYGSSIVQSASATIGSTSATATTPDLSAVRTTVTTEANQVTTAKAALTAMGVGTDLSGNTNFNVAATGIDMFEDTTLFSGIYSSTGFMTMTANKTLTLDGQGLDNQSWIFNIGNYLTTGADTIINVVNVGANASVYWNTVGYTSLGADSDFYGTVLANTYVSVGAGAYVHDIGTSCGAVYSETSYVSTGANSVIGGNGCAATSIPEPESFGMLLAALAFFGFKRSRKA